MQDSTLASNETTENFLKALAEHLANPTTVKKTITRLIYDPTDGQALHITVEPAKENEAWIEIDNKLWPQYAAQLKFLKYVNGKIINTRQIAGARTIQLVPGDTWHTDNDYRLIIGEPSVNTSGWSRKAS